MTFCETYATYIDYSPDCHRTLPPPPLSTCTPTQLYRKDLAQFERNARASTRKHATGTADQGGAASNAEAAFASGRPADASGLAEGTSEEAAAEEAAAEGATEGGASGDSPAAAEEAPGEDAEAEAEYDEFEDEYHDEGEDEGDGASVDKRPKLS